MAFLIKLRGGGLSSIGKLGKLVGTLVWDFGMCHPKLRTPSWWTRYGKIHFSVPSGQNNTAFLGCPETVRNCMTEAGLRSRSVAVKEKLLEEHRLYRFAFVVRIMWIVTGEM
jgi:hypothetical protein